MYLQVQITKHVLSKSEVMGYRIKTLCFVPPVEVSVVKFVVVSCVYLPVISVSPVQRALVQDWTPEQNNNTFEICIHNN